MENKTDKNKTNQGLIQIPPFDFTEYIFLLFNRLWEVSRWRWLIILIYGNRWGSRKPEPETGTSPANLFRFMLWWSLRWSTLMMVRELLSGLLLLLLHEHMSPLGRVLTRVLREGARRGTGRAPRPHAPHGPYKPRLVLRRGRPHLLLLLLLRSKHLLLLLLQHFSLLLSRYAGCRYACGQ